MNKNEFQELVRSGLGRAIIYARENDVQPFRDVILDACLHCYSADAQCEGTRAGYMLELVNLLPDRQFYCDEVLKALPGSGDDWDAVQRFHFATYMSFDGDERARQVMYESFEPGPNMGEAVAIDFVRMDGLKGLLFAAAKIGALLISKPNEMDGGWLWMQAREICGEQEATTALCQAGAIDPRVEAYRLAAVAGEANSHRGIGTWEEIKALSYAQLKPKLLGLRAFRLSGWGKRASTDDVERAAHGLMAAQVPEEQIQHLRVFSRRPFPLDPSLLLKLSFSANEDLALAAAVALAQIMHPSVREVAFRLVGNRLAGRDAAIAMLGQNWVPNDHEVVLSWFESELDRDTRHHMETDLRNFWESHPDPASELRMLCSLYEKGPCSFCREFVVQRLIELDSLSASMRAECARDANEDIRLLVGAE